MKYCVILLAVMLTGCEQYVADPAKLSEKMTKCESVGMYTILKISESVDGNVKVKCVEKDK